MKYNFGASNVEVVKILNRLEKIGYTQMDPSNFNPGVSMEAVGIEFGSAVETNIFLTIIMRPITKFSLYHHNGNLIANFKVNYEVFVMIFFLGLPLFILIGFAPTLETLIKVGWIFAICLIALLINAVSSILKYLSDIESAAKAE
jgi:hypothetical protein